MPGVRLALLPSPRSRRFICSRRWSARWSRSTAAGPSRNTASPSISPTMASTPTSSCRRVVAGPRLGAAVAEERFRRARPDAHWVAFGSGEERVYLETPRWRDITPRTIWSALTGGKRVMHVEWVADPAYAVREIRLRPEEYRRLWAAIRADFGGREPQRIDHPGYGRSRRFLPGDRQGQRDPHLQQLGRRAACAWPGSRPACGRRSCRG